MKFMENSNNNWLGFSLSPQMNPMEVSSDSDQHQTEQSPPPSVPNAVQNCNFFLSPTQLTPHGLCYEGENTAELYSHLSFMPIKSDGSLCLMEALTRSSQNQGMVPSPSPKLEDFLGATGCGPNTNTGAHHQYVNNERESTATTMYYDQSHEPLELLQQPFNFQPLQLQDMYHHHHHHHHHPPLEEEEEPMGGDDDGFSSLKNWVSIDGASSLGYGDLHSLSLSMSPGSQSSTVTAPQQQHHHVISNDCMALEVGGKKRGSGKVGGSQKQPVHRKSIDTFGQRTSQYRGVTRHRWTGRYEAHLWDNSCKKEGQTRKGRQVYLGGYDMEDKAARSYDLAALKYWGPSTHINFPLENYHEELQEMKNMSRQEYVAHLRRKSSGFSRGASMYRGVTRHHQHGRWQARIGRVAGNKDLYLGTFSTQEDAAEAYDVAAIKFRGASAVTNFDITRYDVEKIIASPTLLSGENARKTKPVQSQNTNKEMNLIQGNNNMTASDWKVVLYESPAQNQNHQQEPVSVAFHGTHMSNPSSLVTSLNSSREGSPNRTGSGLSLVYSKAEPGFNVGSGSIGSWIPSAHDLRPTAISMAQMPLFAAWSDV